MNREIEFRGKVKRPDGVFVSCTDKNDGEWVFGDLEVRRKGGRVLIHLYNTDGGYYRQYDVDPDTVGQFTGLRDKNGKEIFEGDIVEVTSLRYGYEDFMKRMLCEIVYDSNLCCFNLLASDSERCMCSTIPDAEIEVIGNIYENPELLYKKE